MCQGVKPSSSSAVKRSTIKTVSSSSSFSKENSPAKFEFVSTSPRTRNQRFCDAAEFIWGASGNCNTPLPFLIYYIVSERCTPTRWQGLACFLGIVFWVTYGMSVCLHRFFAHQAFKTSWLMTNALGIMGTLTNQKGVLWWSSKHNRHHKFCDLPEDPHSWLQTSYMYAWIGWTFWDYKTDWEFVPKAYQNNRTLVAINAMGPVIFWGWMYALYKLVGAEWTIYGYWIPTVVSTLGSLDFNLQFHPKHPADGDPNRVCKATDVSIRGDEPWIPKMIGESAHLDHHAHPRKGRRPGPDIAYWGMIYPLENIGLIWNTQFR